MIKKNEEQGKSEHLLIAVLDYIYSSLVGIFIFNFILYFIYIFCCKFNILTNTKFGFNFTFKNEWKYKNLNADFMALLCMMIFCFYKNNALYDKWYFKFTKWIPFI